ncbi:MAG: hypothetical protein KDN22_32205, partial [Verrucomicrobiae bacterium]|nr:hypothetical protein [Verrucomicrobiae bacterium]
MPQLINFQGRVQVGGVDFSGPGLFKFALVDSLGDTTHWSNDGTSAAGTEPSAAVSIAVTNGLYSVLLGDATIPNMTVVPATVFTNDEVLLRIWFDDGTHGFQRLEPDQRIAAVGYAMMAANAQTAQVAQTVPDGAITSAKLATGAVGAAQLADGSVTVAKLNASSGIARVQTGMFRLLDRVGVNRYDVTFPTAFSGLPFVTTSQGTPEVTPTGFSVEIEAPRGEANVVDDGPGSKGAWNSLAVVAGRPAISYYDDHFKDLKFAISDHPDGDDAWTVTTVDGAGGVQVGRRDTSLRVVGGRPAIGYYDHVNETLKFAINANADGSGAWTNTTVDATGAVGRFASLVEIGGRPAISYYDSGNSDLKFAINANADGSGVWAITAVDTSGDVGQYGSLAVVDGRPAISYYDEGNRDLKFAINASADGSGVWVISVVDSAGTVGQYTSLAVVDGRPAIGYNSTSQLKFAINADSTGSGIWTIRSIDGNSYYLHSTTLAVVNGKPAITYGGGLAVSEGERSKRC